MTAKEQTRVTTVAVTVSVIVRVFYSFRSAAVGSGTRRGARLSGSNLVAKAEAPLHFLIPSRWFPQP